MEFSELIKLLGIVIVIVGFILKLEPILIILLGLTVTAIVSLMDPITLLSAIGSSFVSNRNMAIFILILLVTGTMERNGLKESAAKLIGKVKGASPGKIIGAYGIMRGFFAMFNVSFGGVAGFVRPVIMPMAIGAIEAKGDVPNEEHVEKIKGMSSGMENTAWFFWQVLFITGSGNLLVQQTLAGLGFEVELFALVRQVIPVSIFAMVWAIIYYNLVDRAQRKKHYGSGADAPKN
ncbi:MAG: DUF969 domain-containing protein [Oscillospiraceae bacterium]|nr:DUF969 domain-containing protein [Oscillospiraceae bacterium]